MVRLGILHEHSVVGLGAVLNLSEGLGLLFQCPVCKQLGGVLGGDVDMLLDVTDLLVYKLLATALQE